MVLELVQDCGLHHPVPVLNQPPQLIVSFLQHRVCNVLFTCSQLCISIILHPPPPPPTLRLILIHAYCIEPKLIAIPIAIPIPRSYFFMFFPQPLWYAIKHTCSTQSRNIYSLLNNCLCEPGWEKAANLLQECSFPFANRDIEICGQETDEQLEGV